MTIKRILIGSAILIAGALLIYGIKRLLPGNKQPEVQWQSETVNEAGDSVIVINERGERNAYPIMAAGPLENVTDSTEFFVTPLE